MASVLAGPVGMILVDAAVSFAIRQLDTLIASYGSTTPTPDEQAQIDAMKLRLQARLTQVEAYRPLPIPQEPGV